MIKRPLFSAFLLLAAFLLCMTGGSVKDLFAQKLPEDATVILNATVEKVEYKTTQVYYTLSSVSCTHKENIQNREEQVRYRKVLLTVPAVSAEAETIQPGNQIQVKACCCGFQTARNVGNFDEKNYYQSLGMEEKFFADVVPYVTNSRIYLMKSLMLRLRKTWADLLQRLIPEETGDERARTNRAVLIAVLTGDRSELPEDTRKLYQESGISHILAVSGLHLSFLGMTLLSFFRKRMPLLYAAFLSGVFMILFCILSGESISATRAVIMFLLRLFAELTGRKFDLLSALGAAGIFLLLPNPWYLYNTGFLLSFGAIAALGIFTPVLLDFLSIQKQRSKKEKLLGALCASLSVTMFTLPIVCNMNYELPLYAVLLNLLVIPLMSYILESGMISIFAGAFSLFCGRMVLGTGFYLISFLEWACVLFSKLPLSVLITGHMDGQKVILYEVVLFSLYFLLRVLCRKKKRHRQETEAETGCQNGNKRVCGRILSVFAAFLLLLALASFSLQDRNLFIYFLDVGQGDGMIMQFPSGKTCMIDGGSSSVKDVYAYRMESTLKYRAIRSVDYAIISHPDEDHISGLLSMLKQEGAGSVRIGTVFLPEIPESDAYINICQLCQERGTKLQTVCEGMQIQEGEVILSCLYPPAGHHADEKNEYSAIWEVHYGDFSALFTGDLDAAGEEKLLQSQKLKGPYDVLKVAHHGSKYSTTEAFLLETEPDIAVISAGEHNSYGHPHPQTLERLQRVQSNIYVTAESGEVDVRVSPEGIIYVQTPCACES